MVKNVTGNRLSNKDERMLRMKDGVWISHRKRVYLYWFKFLQEAEKSPDHKVQWKKYRGWGSGNVILGSKFDDWWEENWKTLFSTKDIDKEPKFGVGKITSNQYERMRLSYLVHCLRGTPIDYIEKQRVRYHGKKMGGKKKVVTNPQSKTNTLSIAYKLYNSERGKIRKTAIAHLNPDDNPPPGVQSTIRKHMKEADKHLKNVSEGVFP
jgi:hypothetical protein